MNLTSLGRVVRGGVLAATIAVIFGSPALQAQTAGNVTLTATINNLTARSGTRHFAVVWVTKADGTFIKTLWKQGEGTDFSDPNGDWADHFIAYEAARGSSTSLDGYSSATAMDYNTTITAPATRANNPIGVSWNCKDSTNTLVSDGGYKFWIQYAESGSTNGVNGPLTTGGLAWTKGAASDTQNPLAQGTTDISPGNNFTGMQIVWTPSVSSYTVTFDAQSGTTPTPATISVTPGSTYGTLATTLRTGYTFGGWWTGINGTGTQVLSTTTVTISAAQTLYAKWTANSYTVTYDVQSGTAASPLTTSVTYATTYGTLATTSRTGYTFGGWWTGTNGTGTQVISTTTVTITAAQTLYAKWTANSYTVTFDTQSGTAASPLTISATYASTYGTLATTTRTGYTLAGWWTGTNGTGTQVTAATSVTITAAQTLYANWTANSYTVTFDTQSGSAASPLTISATYGSTYGTLATTSRTGYTLAGWWTGTNGTGTQVISTTTVTITAAQTLYANWTANSYTVTFDTQSGTAASPLTISATYGSTYGTLATTSRTGYTLAGWWTGTNGTGTQVTAATSVTITAAQTLYAKWTANSYTVTFDTQSGTAASPLTISATYASTYGTLATTTRTGYTLAGWWTGTNGTGTQVTAATSVTITAAQTLYANWTANSYTVTFDTQSGTAASPLTISATYGSTYGTLATTTRTGYTLAGWWTGTNGTGTQVTAATTVTITAAQTLYAKWTSNSTYDNWATLAGIPLAQAGPDQTPQNDGVKNLIKFAFNMNATKPDTSTLSVGGNGTSGQPGTAVVGGVLRLEFLRRKDNPGITYTPQFSSSMGTGSWIDASVINPPVLIDAIWERVVIDDPAALTGKRFGRVRVDQTP